MKKYTVYTDRGEFRDVLAFSVEHAARIVTRNTYARVRIEAVRPQ